MNLVEQVEKVQANYQSGQNIFRRVSVGFLLERISQLEQAAQQSFAPDVAKCPPSKHNFVNGLHCSVCGESQF